MLRKAKVVKSGKTVPSSRETTSKGVNMAMEPSNLPTRRPTKGISKMTYSGARAHSLERTGPNTRGAGSRESFSHQPLSSTQTITSIKEKLTICNRTEKESTKITGELSSAPSRTANRMENSS